MESPKIKKVVAWAVNFTCFLLIISLTKSCATTNQITHISDIKRWKSESGGSYLILKSFHWREKLKKFPATYRINNLIFSPLNYQPLKLDVMPGIFSITAGGIGKKWTTLEPVKINKRDSIVVKIFLKNDTEPLH